MTTNGPTDGDGGASHPDPDTLGDLDDGLLEPAVAAQVDEHLRGCPGCSGLVFGMAEVRRLLADQPLPELPTDVAGRLDVALADASAQRQGVGHASVASTGATVQPLGAATPRPRTAGSDLRTRRQVRSEDRSHRPARTVPRVLAAAAALLVVGGTATVVSQQLGARGGAETATSRADMAEGGAAEIPAPSALAAPEPPVLATGTDYQRDTLTEQALSLIARAEEAAGGGFSAESAPSESALSGAAPSEPTADELPTAGDEGGLLGTTEGLAGCLEELGVPDGTLPAVVDIALFEGREAALVAVPSRGGDAYEVWVVARDCRPGADGLLSFTPVPRP